MGYLQEVGALPDREDRLQFEEELAASLETAALKSPDSLWPVTIEPWWEVCRQELEAHGYQVELGAGNGGDFEASFRVWNETFNWLKPDAAWLTYRWDAAEVDVSQRITGRNTGPSRSGTIPISRLTSEKVREHLRHFVKDIKTRVASLDED